MVRILGTGKSRVVKFTIQPLYCPLLPTLRGRSPVPIERWLSGTDSCSARVKEKKNLFPCWVSNPGFSSPAQWLCWIHSLGSLSREYTFNKAGYLQRNFEARSCNHCGSGKAISITCSERVLVALGIQHAIMLRHIAICGRPGSTKCLHIIS